MSSKKIIKIGIVVAVFVLFFPSFVLADDSKDKLERRDNFCSRLGSEAARVAREIGDSEKRFKKEGKERLVEINGKKIKQENELTQERANKDINRDALISKLEAQATTEAQVLAIAEFKKSVEEATRTRRLAIDNTDRTFQNSLYQLALGKKASQDDVVRVFKTSIESALGEAEALCASGSESQNIKKIFEKNLKNSQNKLKADRKVAEKTARELENLQKNYKKEIQKVTNNFNDTVKRAGVDLKEALR